jgi:branched-chain amino acid transport system ATP-binding protein/branched-chain amino acid transport system permease protein
MIVVEHHAETVLTIVDKAYVLVNGAVAYEGEAGKPGEDRALQAKLLGVVHDEESTSFAEEPFA